MLFIYLGVIGLVSCLLDQNQTKYALLVVFCFAVFLLINKYMDNKGGS